MSSFQEMLGVWGDFMAQGGASADPGLIYQALSGQKTLQIAPK